MNSIEVGNIVEIEVQLGLVKNGFNVFTPINDGCPVDLIFTDVDNEPKKVQVKSARKSKTGFKIDFRKSTSSSRVRKKVYTEDEIDYFATVFEGVLYMFPIEKLRGKTQITFRLNKLYLNENDDNFFAEDFKF